MFLLQMQTNREPTHLAQKKDPWNRLNSTATLASARREIYHHDPKVRFYILAFLIPEFFKLIKTNF